MLDINRDEIKETLGSVGFECHRRHPGIFLVGRDREIAPAYVCRLIKKKRKVRLGGGLGIYFRYFEELWSQKADRYLRKQFTLPMILDLGNYVGDIDSEVFEYADSHTKIICISNHIMSFLKHFPLSHSEFSTALRDNAIAKKAVGDYFHIVDYFTDDNPFFLKSVAFIRWYRTEYPEYFEDLEACLSGAQRRRLGAIEDTVATYL